MAHFMLEELNGWNQGYTGHEQRGFRVRCASTLQRYLRAVCDVS